MVIDKRPDSEAYDKEELAVITRARYGIGDRDVPWLDLTISFLHGGTGLVFIQPEANTVIKDANVSDVKDMVGRVCVIICEDNFVRYRRMFK